MASPREVEPSTLLAHDRPPAAPPLDRFVREVRRRGALPRGDPSRVSATPVVLSSRQARLLARASESIAAAAEIGLDHLLASPDQLDAWGVPEDVQAIARVDPGYPRPVQVSRFDGLLSGERFQILELNCDSPGGAARADVLDEALHAATSPTPARRGQADRWPRVDRLASTLEHVYRQWRTGCPGEHPTRPRVVLTDWLDVTTRPDIELTLARLRELGIEAAFADPRELELDGDELVHEGRRVDLVYKRVIVRELLAEPEAQDLLTAYQAGTVCMVNPPRAALAGDKRLLALLQTPELAEALPGDTNAAVHRFLPWTRVLAPGRTRWRGGSLDTRDLALEHRDELVLKPATGYGGHDVHLGLETDPETWGHLVDEHIDEGAWVLQRLVSTPTDRFERLVDGRPRSEIMHVNVNPFVFGGQYAGAYTRVSAARRVNVSRGGSVAPTLTARR